MVSKDMAVNFVIIEEIKDHLRFFIYTALHILLNSFTIVASMTYLPSKSTIP